MPVKNMPILCPSCQSPTFLRGHIADSNAFAGRVLDSPLKGGCLYHCKYCSLEFRWPQPSKDSLNHLYESGNDIAWQYVPKQRRDWTFAKELIQVTSGCSSVLDVGCFDGSFLTFIGQKYDRYGVEIHPVAFSRAEAAGITMVARDLEDINANHSFDCIVSMDVAEHVADPLTFLKSLAAITKPGGMIILSTGNTEAWSWRIAGSRYWYCHIAEHISFINPTWCNYAAQHLELGVKQISTFSHSDASLLKRARDVVINLTYLSVPALGRLLRKRGIGGINVRQHPSLADVPPGWMSASDHLLVVFQKP